MSSKKSKNLLANIDTLARAEYSHLPTTIPLPSFDDSEALFAARSGSSFSFPSPKKTSYSHSNAIHDKTGFAWVNPVCKTFTFSSTDDFALHIDHCQLMHFEGGEFEFKDPHPRFKTATSSNSTPVQWDGQYDDVDRPYDVGNLSYLDKSEKLAKSHEEKAQHFTIDQSKARLANLRRKVSHAARWLIGDILGTGYSEDRSQNHQYKRTHNAWMSTLTYGDHPWDASDIKVYLNHMRRWAANRGFKLRYVWVAEIQEHRRIRTGAHGVHYHIIFWIPRGKNMRIPKGDTRGWWTKGTTKTEISRSPVGYLLKYASKGNKLGCEFLKGMRTHGSGGFYADTKLRLSFSHKPKYVKDHYQDYQTRPIRVKGGGWVSKATGDFLDSLYECLTISPLVIRLKAAYTGVRIKDRFYRLIDIVNPHFVFTKLIKTHSDVSLSF